MSNKLELYKKLYKINYYTYKDTIKINRDYREKSEKTGRPKSIESIHWII